MLNMPKKRENFRFFSMNLPINYINCLGFIQSVRQPLDIALQSITKSSGQRDTLWRIHWKCTFIVRAAAHVRVKKLGGIALVRILRIENRYANDDTFVLRSSFSAFRRHFAYFLPSVLSTSQSVKLNGFQWKREKETKIIRIFDAWTWTNVYQIQCIKTRGKFHLNQLSFCFFLWIIETNMEIVEATS